MADSMEQIARAFFEACEGGQGWQACAGYCQPGASFSCQAEPLAGIARLEDYVEWVKGLSGPLPDGSVDLKSWALDLERHAVSAYAVFSGTHTGEGGPCPPTGKRVSTDYVYVMFFARDRIRHMVKIWHSGLALKELGWA